MLERGDTESMLAAGESCTFAEAAASAQAAGAAALLLFDANDPQHDTIPRTLRTLGPQALDLAVTIPVFAINFNAVTTIRDALDQTDGSVGSVMVHLAVAKTVREITAGNIIATSRTGDPTKKVVIGSHMDGVTAGPGINDNGSGTSTNLEIALSLARLMARGAISLTNQVRFCWWGAEEEGLVGSRWYADHLPEQEMNTIALNLNYDMVGSPNYIVGVYDGTQISGDPDYPVTQQIGSLALMEMYAGYLESIGSAHVPVEFNGRSDYGPFLERGIPCGGLETGAEKIKTEAERQMFGGWANAAYDTCYHQFCDTIENISPEALAINAPTASHAVEYLATHPDLQGFLGYSTATATLMATGNPSSSAVGTVTIRTLDVDTVEISYECRGLAPNSVHGFHIHEAADFSNGCLSTGTGAQAALPPAHHNRCICRTSMCR
jgi:Zn-dependent M28 family amino/carboxypeptidase